MYVRQLVFPFCKLGNGGSKIIYITENVSVNKKDSIIIVIKIIKYANSYIDVHLL